MGPALYLLRIMLLTLFFAGASAQPNAFDAFGRRPIYNNMYNPIGRPVAPAVVTGAGCCRAINAECIACQSGMTRDAYCSLFPSALDCAVATEEKTEAKPVLGANACTYGPSYWCASEANAMECQYDYSLCEKKPEAKPVLGANPCTYGPSYWCASEANAMECQYDYSLCEKKPEAKPVLGANPCTYGPSYWCASEANAMECKYDYSRCEKETVTDIQKPSEVMDGTNPCSDGPAYWCGSEANAKECKYDYSRCTIDIKKPVTSEPVILGTNPCSWGPAYWCRSEANANKCNYDYSLCTVTELKKPSGSGGGSARPMLGSDKCTYGPSYWCASEANAMECNYDYSRCEKKDTQEDKFDCSNGGTWTNEKAQWCCKNKKTGCFYATLEKDVERAEGDEFCARGLLSNNGAVCCSAQCGSCGGKGCGERAGGASACCKQTIIRSEMLCTRKQAPCVMPGAGYTVDPADFVLPGGRN